VAQPPLSPHPRRRHHTHPIFPQAAAALHRALGHGYARPQKLSDFDRQVDRDVPIAISLVKHRAGTARSTPLKTEHRTLTPAREARYFFSIA
jgi:hypothetical protein